MYFCTCTRKIDEITYTTPKGEDTGTKAEAPEARIRVAATKNLMMFSVISVYAAENCENRLRKESLLSVIVSIFKN